MDLLRHNLKKRQFAINENINNTLIENKDEIVKVENINEKDNIFKLEIENIKIYIDNELNKLKKELHELKQNVNNKIQEDKSFKVDEKPVEKLEDKSFKVNENLVEKLEDKLNIFSSILEKDSELKETTKPKSKPRAKKTDSKNKN